MKSPYLLSIVAGILIGTSYIPFPPWAIFFGFIPLWLAWLDSRSLKQILICGWLTQIVLTLIGFNWVSYTVHEFGHIPWPFAILILFGFAGISTLSIPLAGAAWWLFAKVFRLSENARLLALPVFMGLAERLTPMIFDWHFGYTWLWAGFPAYQLADIVGFIGLSNVGHIFNALFLVAWLKWRRREKWIPWFATPLILFASMNLLGWWHGQNLKTPDAKARFLLVQANIGNEEKLMAEQGPMFADTVLNRFVKLTKEGLQAAASADKSIDFAVWPETAFPDYIDDPDLQRGFELRLKGAIKDMHVKLITGAYSHILTTGQPTNSFFILNDQGQWMDPPYHKTMLLAFGEYFPGANWFPKLRDWFPEVADFGRGPGPSVLKAGDLRVGAQICYEGLFDWFARSLANKGAQVVVNITNDSWYGTWEEPYQHLYMTLAKAVEVRRPLIRDTNTGISAVALASGQVLPLSPVHEAWQNSFDVPYLTNPPTTLFMTWGYWIFPVLMSLTFVGLALWPKRL